MDVDARAPGGAAGPGAASGCRLTRRRVGGGALAVAGAAAAACSQNAAKVAVPAPSQKPVTLTIDNDWTAGDRLKIIQAWVERIPKVYPHITPDLRALGSGAPGQAATIAAFASGTEGDLVQLAPPLVPVIAPKGRLFEITPTLAALKFDPATVYDFKGVTHSGGKRYGLMVQLNGSSMVYNKNAFQEAGVKEPAPTWTWEDYLEASRTLNRPQQDLWGTKTETAALQHWLAAADVRFVDAGGTTALWDTAPVRAVLQWHADLVLRHRVAPSPREQAEKRLNFNPGNFATEPHVTPLPSITTAVAGKFAWDILPRPRHPTSGKSAGTMNGHSYMITARAHERGASTEAARALLEIFSKPIQDLYVSGLDVSTLPTLKATAESPANLEKFPPNMKRYTLDAVAGARTLADGTIIGLLDAYEAARADYQALLNGEVSLEQAAVNMPRASNAALAAAAR
jgi:ABC-type glycerol-3-phosphate transport system substrate-binding protein